MGGVGFDVDAASELDERLRHLLHALTGLALADDALLGAGVTEAVAVKAGDSVLVRDQDLGSVSMRFV